MLIAEDALPDLPIRAVLPAVLDALARSGTAVLVAPPGTGKTTLVPLALATSPAKPDPPSPTAHPTSAIPTDRPAAVIPAHAASAGHPGAVTSVGSVGGKAADFPDASAVGGFGRVIVAEPRRVAARAAARRMAELIGEKVGGRIGYTVRGDRRVSRDTVVEVVTTGVLVRRLQRDPDLAGTAVVVLDECHERHLDSDLALAFLVEVRATVRPDLKVLATSATAESRRFAEILGTADPGDLTPDAERQLDNMTPGAAWQPADPAPDAERQPDNLAPGADRQSSDPAPGAARQPDDPASDAARQPDDPASDAARQPDDPASDAARQPDDPASDAARQPGAGPAPIITAEARLFPVDIRWCPPPQAVAPPHGLRVDPKLLEHVAATVRRALAEGDGDVLTFLPGAREIERVAGLLRGGTADVVSLHGRQSGSAQDAALRPGPRRRVVLATAVAESSLTVPGVRAVVDAGLSRVPRMDHARGLGTLVTVPVSRAAALQRAGRAGREAPGRVYRCWSQAQHDRLPAQPEPEIAAADLTGFVLDLAWWGHSDGRGLALPDPPPAGPVQTALATLRDLGALDADGRITARGRALADAGLHPRLARALLDGAPLVGGRRAAELIALLDEDRSTGDDLVAAWRRARSTNDPAWRAESRRLTAALARGLADSGRGGPGTPSPRHSDSDSDNSVPKRSEARSELPAEAAGGQRAGSGSRPPPTRAKRPPGTTTTTTGRIDTAGDRSGGLGSAGLPDDLAAGLVVGLAYPERVARIREPGGRTYLMAGGTAAELALGSGLAGSPWLAIADADRAPGARTARIRGAAPLDESTALQAAATLQVSATEIGWVDGDVQARVVRRLGAITISERRLDDPDPGRVLAALLDGLRREGLSLLNWTRGAVELRERLAFAHVAMGTPWPEVDDAALLDAAGGWLESGTARRRADLARIDVVAGLRRLLPWAVAGRLDEVAPERLPVPSGSRIRVDYTDPAAPVLAVKVQEAFGWHDAPRLADGRVPLRLHLLSPAGRPVAVTSDLASFWVNAYPQVRAELRGRYPKHPWPADPTTAEPTRRTNRRA